jgi:hypothetical protein
MSLEGVGAVAIIPAVGMVVLPVAALAAAGYVGGVVIVQAGKGMIACGNMVRKSVQEHLEREQEIAKLCKDYEKRVLASARKNTVSITRTKSSKEFTQMLTALKRRRKAVVKTPQVPKLIVEDRGLFEPSPPSAIHSIQYLKRTRREMQSELDELKDAISTLEGAEWSGLVSTDDLSQKASKIENELEQNEESASEQDIRLLRDIRTDLNRLRSEIAMRANSGSRKIEERSQAIDLMEKTASLFSETADAVQEFPETAPALELAQEMILSADELFRQGKIIGCLTRAQNVIDYMSQITQGAQSLRKANTRVAIRGLEEFVKGFIVEDEQDLPAAIRDNVAKMTGMIAEAHGLLDHDLPACWKIIDEAQDAAQHLASIVETYYAVGTQRHAANLIQDTLVEMNYHIGESSKDADKTLSFKAVRDDGAYFKIELDQGGVIGYKAENFKGVACQTETKILMDKLREKGLIADVQSEFNMAAAAERMREVLLRQGYIVQEEAAEDGTSHTLLAQKGEEQKEIEVTHDAAESQPKSEVEVPYVNPYAGYQRYLEWINHENRRLKI